MKVALGTYDFDDVVRRAIRWRIAEPGLATREECRAVLMSHGVPGLDILVDDMVSYEENTPKKPKKSRGGK